MEFSCNVCCTSAELLLTHMNGKKHTAKVVKLAQAAKESTAAAAAAAAAATPAPAPVPAGKKRKAEPSKPAMIGIQGAHYWCFPCSVSGGSDIVLTGCAGVVGQGY